MTVAEIVQLAQALSLEERKEVIKQLIDTFDVAASGDQLHDILEFEGIAAHLADDVDPQVYVRQLREEWNDRP